MNITIKIAAVINVGFSVFLIVDHGIPFNWFGLYYAAGFMALAFDLIDGNWLRNVETRGKPLRLLRCSILWPIAWYECKKWKQN